MLSESNTPILPEKRIFYLVSFPKAGNTWVNFTIANMYNQLTGAFPEIDFFNIHDINPEIRSDHKEVKEPFFKEFPWFYMTHSPYKAGFENALLVIRNPWDVMYSYYHYLKGERLKNFSLAEVITHEKFGIRALVAHNESFFRNCKNLLIVTYENMHVNPFKEAGKIARFIDLAIDEQDLQSAVDKASFTSMRKIEEQKGRKYGTPGFLFTRKGITGEGQLEIRKNKDLDDYIMNEIKKSPLLFLLYG